MEKRDEDSPEVFDDESLLTPEQKRIIAEYKKRPLVINKDQKPTKRPEVRAEKPSWLARNRPGIEKKIRQFVDGTLLYNPRRHKKP